LARGPNVMLGYADDPESTAQVLTPDGWLRTGDLGKLDRHGQLVIVGRAKEVIVASNGENVYPDDVEARLGRVEAVLELAVLGVPDGRGGERVALVAVPEEDATLGRDERHARARAALEREIQKLPLAMRLASITLLDRRLPRTASRKVRRAELRRLFERRLEVAASSRAMAADPVDGAAAPVRAGSAPIPPTSPASLAFEQS